MLMMILLNLSHHQELAAVPDKLLTSDGHQRLRVVLVEDRIRHLKTIGATPSRIAAFET